MKLPFNRPLLACLMNLAALTELAAQEAPMVSVPFDGTEAFGHILHSFELKPALNVDAVQLAPEKTLVIIFGDLRKLDTQSASALSREKLEQLRARGGALLIASDYPDEGRLPAGLSCRGQPVHANGRSIYRHQGVDPCAQCPVVRVWSDPSHPLFQGLRKGLATNRPSYLRGNLSEFKRLALFSDDCAGTGRDIYALPADAAYIFGSPKGAAASGRAVVLAGQGVFLNGMLIQTDNDNFAFAWNAVGWLTEGPGGRRTHALFIEDGKVISNFALPLTRFGAVPIPPIQVINRMIRGLEDENIFNRLLVESVGKEPYLRGLVLAGSLVALMWGAWRLMHGRFRLDTGVPLIVAKQDSAPPALPVLWQRQEELRRLGNLWEPAQVLARQFFLDQAGITVPLWDHEEADPPPVAAAGSFWQRRRLERQVQRLWDLAHSSPARPVSPRQFDDWLRLVDEVTAALAEKRLAFSTRR